MFQIRLTSSSRNKRQSGGGASGWWSVLEPARCTERWLVSGWSVGERQTGRKGIVFLPSPFRAWAWQGRLGSQWEGPLPWQLPPAETHRGLNEDSAARRSAVQWPFSGAHLFPLALGGSPRRALGAREPGAVQDGPQSPRRPPALQRPFGDGRGRAQKHPRPARSLMRKCR